MLVIFWISARHAIYARLVKKKKNFFFSKPGKNKQTNKQNTLLYFLKVSAIECSWWARETESNTETQVTYTHTGSRTMPLKYTWFMCIMKKKPSSKWQGDLFIQYTWQEKAKVINKLWIRSGRYALRIERADRHCMTVIFWTWIVYMCVCVCLCLCVCVCVCVCVCFLCYCLHFPHKPIDWLIHQVRPMAKGWREKAGMHTQREQLLLWQHSENFSYNVNCNHSTQCKVT